jgi:hypothetical protein
MRDGMSMSPARVFFGFAVFVAACAFFANAVGFEVFDTNAFLFVTVGALACCLIGCSVEIWRSGFQCMTGNAKCNPVHASGFWSSFGTYAWYCGVLGACICCVAYADDAEKPKNFAAAFGTMAVPAFYCFCYGMFYKAVGMSIACAVCSSCVPGGMSSNATADQTIAHSSAASRKSSKENVSV